MDALSVLGMCKHPHLGISQCHQKGGIHSITQATGRISGASSQFFKRALEARLAVWVKCLVQREKLDNISILIYTIGDCI